MSNPAGERRHLTLLHVTTGGARGGVIVGLFEAAGTGCLPDAQKAASYIPAYGMIILTLTLLLRPTGLFGRRFASGAHGKF